MESYLIDHYWILILAWVVLYTSDYYLTLYGASLHRRQTYIEIDGSYELNPVFVSDIDKNTKISLRHIVWLITGTLMIYVPASTIGFPVFGTGVMAGSLLIMELTIHLRHIGNIYYYRKLVGPNPGLSGHLTESRKSLCQRSAVQIAAYCGFTLIIFALTYSPMLLGGSLSLFCLALKHKSYATKCNTVQPTVNEACKQSQSKEQP